MTIERLHCPDGYPLDFEGDVQAQLQEAAQQATPLPEGDYDLTSDGHHRLTVLSDGTGVYKAKFPGFIGQVRHLPNDQNVIILTGHVGPKKEPGISNIIFYKPGGNPPKKI